MSGKVITFDDIKKKYNLDNPNAGGGHQRTIGMGGMSKKQMDALFYFWFIMCILFWFVSPLSGLFITGFFVIINYRRLKGIVKKYLLKERAWVKVEKK